MCSNDELFLPSREGYNIQVSTETIRHVSTYIILFLNWHNESINDDKNDDLYTPYPYLTRPVFVLLKHDITYITAVIEWEYKSKFETTNDTPYLALTGKLCGVFCYDFGENWPRYNGTARYYGLNIDAS